MRRMGMVYGGSLCERRVLDRPELGRWVCEEIPVTSLPGPKLDELDVLLIPEGTHRGQLQDGADAILGILQRGATVAVFGDQPTEWLPGLRWEWRSVRACGPLTVAHPDHHFHRHVRLDRATWHHHGVLRPPTEATTLVATGDGATVMYADQVSTPGTIVAATFDPISHFGTSLMPEAGRFLAQFLPWLTAGWGDNAKDPRTGRDATPRPPRC